MASVNMKAHLTEHTGTTEFRCSVCGKEFKYKKGLQYHNARDHLELHQFS